MIAVIIISIIAVLSTTALALFEPRLHPRHPGVRIYWVAPLIGAILLVLMGSISLPEVASGLLADSAVNPIKILVLFFSMTLMSIFLDEVGFFRYLANAVLRHAGSSQLKLFVLLYAAVSVLTVFTSNDVVVLTFTPFICYFAKNAEIDPLPYLIGEFVAANTWSMALIIGNPTNIYLAAGNGIDFAGYLGVMLLPTVLAGAVSFGVLLLLFYRRLRVPMRPIAEDLHLKDKPTVALALTCLCVCIAFLIFSSYLDMDMWLISLDACVILYLVAISELVIRRRGMGPVNRSLHRAPYDVVPFVLSMFVIVMALNKVGATAMLCEMISGTGEIWKSGISSFLAANLLNNIPMSVLYSTVVTPATGVPLVPALYAAVVGSNIGAFFTPMGALAGIMWMALLKQHGVSLSFGKFVLYGAAISIPTLLAALAGLEIIL